MSPSHAASGTPAPVRDRLSDFYLGVSKGDMGPVWAGETLAMHFGLECAPGGSFEGQLVESNRFLAELAGIDEGCRVLDAGCGVGGSSLWLARERGAHVTGITIVPEHVEAARRHAAARGSGRGTVDFRLLDFMSTGFPEASFDVVWNIESLCHCHDKRAYFEHVHELLSDGGRLACLDIFIAGEVPELDVIRDGCVLGELHTPAEVEALLAEAGFIDIQVLDLSARVRSSVEVVRKSTELAIGWWRMEELLLGVDTRQRQHQAHASLLCADSMLSGSIVYCYVGARRAPR